MRLWSPAFAYGDWIPSKHSYHGENLSPPLCWDAPPKGTQSFVCIMEDSDVPLEVRSDGLWVHWVVYHIDPTLRELKENDRVCCGLNTAGEIGYMGPAPPDRPHRYDFTLYALDIDFPQQEGLSKAEVLARMEGHIVDQAHWQGLYAPTSPS